MYVNNSANHRYNGGYMTDRETLEAEAIDEVCECQYYELQDTINETPDDELREVINHTIPCEICGN